MGPKENNQQSLEATTSPSASLGPVEPAQLHEFLIERFSLDELRSLAFALSVDYELFPHDTKENFSRELITYFKRRDGLSPLVEEILKQRESKLTPELLAQNRSTGGSITIDPIHKPTTPVRRQRNPILLALTGFVTLVITIGLVLLLKPYSPGPNPTTTQTAIEAAIATAIVTPTAFATAAVTTTPIEPTVKIEQGMAIIGSNMTPESGHGAEFPKASIKLAAFEIDQFEVSNQNYKLCVTATARPCTEPGDEGINQYNDTNNKTNHPVVGVTAIQAAEYCRWRRKRLPTSLEWERAARGVNGENWPWGNSPNPNPGNVNFHWESTNNTVAVDQFEDGAREENNGKIYNLVGNVSEWTASYSDWRTTWNKIDQSKIFPNTNPSMVWDGFSGTVRSDGNGAKWQLIIRGGSWKSGINQITYNNFARPAESYNDLGFRCVS